MGTMNKKRLAKLGGILFVLIGILSFFGNNFSDVAGFIGGVVFFLAIGGWMLWVGFRKEPGSEQGR